MTASFFGSRGLAWAMKAGLIGLASTSPLWACGEVPTSIEAGQANDAADPLVTPEPGIWAESPPLTPSPVTAPPVLALRPGPPPPYGPFPAANPGLAVPTRSPAKPETSAAGLVVESLETAQRNGRVDAIYVTFNQPMVSRWDLARGRGVTPPLVVDPRFAHGVRWVGAKTLAIDPTAPLALSTTYRVTFPAGMRATSGDVLVEPANRSFSTSPLGLVEASFGEAPQGVGPQPTILLRFNQAVDVDAVVSHLRIVGAGNEMALVRGPAPARGHASPYSTTVTCRPALALQPGTQYTLRLPPGVFGEGPVPSETITVDFSTRAKLTLSKPVCPCVPSRGITLTANNPLADPDLPAKVHVTPPVAGLAVRSSGRKVWIHGDFSGNTVYRITVDRGVLGDHGQRLATPFNATVAMGPQPPRVTPVAPNDGPVILEKADHESLGVWLAGIDRLEVKARAVAPDEILEFLDLYPRDEHWDWPQPDKPPSYLRSVSTAQSRRRPARYDIDIGEALAPTRMAWVLARSNPTRSGNWVARHGFSQFVMVTDLGVVSAVDHAGGVAQVTRLSTGEPVPGAATTVRDAQGPIWSGTTDEQGMVRFGLPPRYASSLLLMARTPDDLSFMRLDRRDLRGNWRQTGAAERKPVVFFFTDRPRYRPGDAMHVSGFVREVHSGPSAKIDLWRANSFARYSLVDPRGMGVFAGETTVDGAGSFSVSLPGAPTLKPGTYRFRIEVPSLFGPPQDFSHDLTIADNSPRTSAARTESTTTTTRPPIAADVRGTSTPDHSVDLDLDRPTYTAGQTAELLVRSPFASARGFVLVERNGMLNSIPVVVTDGVTKVRFTVTEQMAGGASISAVLTRGRVHGPTPDDPGTPAVALGQTDLPVDRTPRMIAVRLTPSAKYTAPGQRVALEVHTTHGDTGDPMPATVLLMAVDERAVDHEPPNPAGFFYASPRSDLWIHALQASVPPPIRPDTDRNGSPNPSLATGPGPAPGAYDPAHAGSAPTRDLLPLGGLAPTIVLPAVRTDAQGEGQVTLTVPAAAGAFRIIAVAAAEGHPDHFGTATTTIRVRKPIAIHTDLPKFLASGDRFEAAVAVHNHTAIDQLVVVAGRGSNVTYPAGATRLVHVPADQTRQIRLDVQVLRAPQTQLQFAALAAAGRDATDVLIPTYKADASSSLVVYGRVEGSAQQDLGAAVRSHPGLTNFEVSLGSSPLLGLRDAVETLADQKYPSADQAASAVVPIIALGDQLDEFAVVSLRDKDTRTKTALAQIQALAGLQHEDGSFGAGLGDDASPYVSAWAMFVLLEAQAVGLEVEPQVIHRGLRHLERLLQASRPDGLGQPSGLNAQTFALWVLAGQQRGAAQFSALWAHRRRMSRFARAMLMGAAHRLGQTSARDRLQREFFDSVAVAEAWQDDPAADVDPMFADASQTRAAALVVLHEIDPDAPSLAALMDTLMGERKPAYGGAWASVQANAWAVMAASRYFAHRQGAAPDFTAQLWLGGRFAGERSFQGHSLASADEIIPVSMLPADPNLIMAQRGTGELYYRLAAQVLPDPSARDSPARRYAVQRAYQAVADQPSDAAGQVRRTDDGGWVVKTGTELEVIIDVVAEQSGEYVVVEDPLPAGFRDAVLLPEPRSSAGPSPLPADTATSPPFDQVSVEEHRVLWFARSLPTGVYRFRYRVTAATRGRFALPPAQATPLYEPGERPRAPEPWNRVTIVE